MEALGFLLRREAELETLTLDVLKTSEIKGETLNPQQVRSSVARHLGIGDENAIERRIFPPDTAEANLYHFVLLPGG